MEKESDGADLTTRIQYKSGPVVIKKMINPLLNSTGAISRCSREKVLMCTQKRELETPL
jgi:hypothetical protein